MHFTPQRTSQQQSGLLLYLLILMGLFVLLEISFFIQGSGFYLGDFKLVADQLKIPVTLLPSVAYFFGIQCFIHLAFVILIWALARLIGVALQCRWAQTEKIGFYLWGLGIIYVLIANQYFFPNSKYAELTSTFLNSTVDKILFWTLSGGCLIAVLLALYGIVLAVSYRIGGVLIVLGTGLIASFSLLPSHPIQPTDAATLNKPNIIIIGIDALRPDFLGKKITPSLDQFLKRATVFSEAMTPLARTYPAWISILTAQHPKTNGIRFDLAQQDHFKFSLSETLPAILRNHGYETIFATDETRFSNIDQRFGFDTIISPPIGFNDFLLGGLNDFPLSNLLINTRVGQYLFPYSYANRPAFGTYDPESFLYLLKPTLEQPRQKPIFLAIHFCLTHYPYMWGTYRARGHALDDYQAAIQRVDQQVHDFLLLLKENNLLEQSIIVVLSDHGEALELPGDRMTEASLFVNKKQPIPHFYPPSVDKETVNRSAGHGTDVLSWPQYHIVLAWQLPGNKHAIIPGKVSLLDIKPTLLNFLEIPTFVEEGKSLMNFITGNKSRVPSQQDFFIESDFSPEAVHSVHPETRQVVFEGMNYFEIDPETTRITVKPSMAKLIISSKQYADFYDTWVLALYPQAKSHMMPILVNRYTGQWSNDLYSSFAKQAPVKHMLTALKKFYGDDILFLPNVMKTQNTLTQ